MICYGYTLFPLLKEQVQFNLLLCNMEDITSSTDPAAPNVAVYMQHMMHDIVLANLEGLRSSDTTSNLVSLLHEPTLPFHLLPQNE